jgi:hypothetical protein
VNFPNLLRHHCMTAEKIHGGIAIAMKQDRPTADWRPTSV